MPEVFVGSHRVCEALADVTTERHLTACVDHNLIDKRCCGGLTIRACDTDGLCHALVACCELYLGDYGNATLTNLLYHRCCVGNTWRLNNLVSIQDTLLGMLSLLILHTPLIEASLELIGNLAHIREEYIETLLLCKDGRAVARNTTTQYCYLTFHIV